MTTSMTAYVIANACVYDNEYDYFGMYIHRIK